MNISSQEDRTSVEEINRAVVVRLVEAWNTGDLNALASLWNPQMVHVGREGEESSSSTTVSEMGRFLSAFPDLRMSLESVVAEGDMVCTRIELTATHRGAFLGTEPTHRPVRCRLMGQLQFADGRVVRHWGVADGLALLVQLGLVPDTFLAATA